MDGDQKPESFQAQEAPKIENQERAVPFSPIPVRPPKKGGVKTFLGIFVLIIFVIGGFLIFKDIKSKNASPSPSPQVEGTINPEATPVPSEAPIDRSKVVISIKNGTGIAGEASYLRDILKSAGYSNFNLTNADTSNNETTTVTYAGSLDQAIQTEITNKLNGIYQQVTSNTSSTQTDDVVIITGLRKGATALPSPTATPEASESPSPTESPTPIPT